ncbi:hypothetical protein COU57_02030 [Candidatus Pacearchaeota archaeon CG10_big_fil_rev_8_21_14_0_10_32_14]|nr:MAG: hypothetical protein COU57_02030 [Candidatus Pacearchaeota archaeon CG10_big_fil_rev_8_21_14_0_10_32_14]
MQVLSIFRLNEENKNSDINNQNDSLLRKLLCDFRRNKMITYNDIYEAAKKNRLVLFESPPRVEPWHLLIASDGYHSAASGKIK